MVKHIKCKLLRVKEKKYLKKSEDIFLNKHKKYYRVGNKEMVTAHIIETSN